MRSLTTSFEFDVGEVVFFKGDQHCAGHRPKAFVICGLVARHHRGGVQRFYRVGGVDEDIPGVLLAREEPEYRPMSRAARRERVEMIEEGERLRLNKSSPTGGCVRDRRWVG